MSEREIQKRILARLSKEYHKCGLFWTRDVGDYVPVSSIKGAISKAMANPGQALSILKGLLRRRLKIGLPGEPDISGCLDGRWVGIEVKKPGNGQQDNQRKFQKAIEARGGIYIVATSPDEAVSALEAKISGV